MLRKTLIVRICIWEILLQLNLISHSFFITYYIRLMMQCVYQMIYDQTTNLGGKTVFAIVQKKDILLMAFVGIDALVMGSTTITILLYFCVLLYEWCFLVTTLLWYERATPSSCTILFNNNSMAHQPNKKCFRLYRIQIQKVPR